MSPPTDLQLRRPARQDRPMALTRSGAMGLWLCRLTPVDLGRPEDCFIPKRLRMLAAREVERLSLTDGLTSHRHTALGERLESGAADLKVRHMVRRELNRETTPLTLADPCV